MDKKIDVYAYGMTVYGVATRETPWGNSSLAEIEARCCSGERPILEINEFVPPIMKQLIERYVLAIELDDINCNGVGNY